MKLEPNDITPERNEPAATTGPSAGRAGVSDLPQSIESALEAIFDKAGPPSRDMGWIAQAEPVKSIRPMPQTQPQLQLEAQPRPQRKSRVLPIAMGSLLALAGMLAGGYLSQHPVWRSQQPLFALQALAPKSPPPTTTPSQSVPSQSVKAISPPPSVEHQPTAGQTSASAPPPAIDRPQVETPAPPPVARADAAVRDSYRRRHDDTASAMRGLVAGCDRGGSCDHHALARADQLLVTAYAEAVEAGVSKPILVDFHRRWDNLRNDSADSPQILVGNYAFLAHDLNRTTSAARGPEARRSRPETQP